MDDLLASRTLWAVLGVIFGILFEAMFGFAKKVIDWLRGRTTDNPQ